LKGIAHSPQRGDPPSGGIGATGGIGPIWGIQKPPFGRIQKSPIWGDSEIPHLGG